ncbi:putative protein DUF5658 [Saccharolobus shibatae B12]|uniref:Uncharacterized protein C-102a n=2 Tax=root TaxID=1 RepID=C102A_SSV1|nr:DUF5658 family protein [Saccharolobus shibatae]NP_039794.1 DUF5658 family protein [Sulfolobus spindle-shaped virus 1]P20206.1 RecName: Full=Uncharacterized protein C-102a [Sulfolobus spindle-shaped virus 1]QXJ30267.1 putative protein DUF5658 [Saccharolobus shibatae B12]CAA30196.1 ORF C-102 [Sulfolobus spindle-shaped virus 1]
MNLIDIILFYGFQFNDYWTTVLGLRVGAEEKNPIAGLFISSPYRLALFKFGLITIGMFILIYVVRFKTWTEIVLTVTDVVECLVTLNNTLTIRRYKRRGVRG